MLTDTSRLTESPGELKRRPDGAVYHDGETIITHLNYALEPWGWDWAELDSGMDAETDEVWVLGQLSARFVVAGPDGGEQTVTTIKIERGWQKVNRLRDGSAKAPGDDKKGAATDALKRCARLLGVGLDAWAKAPAGRPAPAPRPASVNQTEAAPHSVDLSPAARADLRARYVETLARARGLDFRASWAGADVHALTDVQVEKYLTLLDNYIRRQESAA